MSRPAHFVDAHRRHWDDAELLLGNARWANADQMYGFSAECGLKAVDAAVSWTARLRRLLERLESDFESEIVLLESRSGLNDVAAATVTDLDAQVLLFAADSESHWTGCDILFRHWRRHELAARIRDRLSIASALTPATETERCLERFRERAWDLFRDRLYDDVPSSGDSDDAFSFDLHDDDAPHDPFAIHWTRGLAAGASLRDFEESTVRQAYASFLERFDKLLKAAGGEEKP